MTDFTIKQITFSDLVSQQHQELFDIIIAAYEIENGNTGIAFKKQNRYPSLDVMCADLGNQGQILLVAFAADGSILGMIRGGPAELDTSEKPARVATVWGPFAVLKTAQKLGIGFALLKHAEEFAFSRVSADPTFKDFGQELRPVSRVDVVNHRSDMLSYYGAKGYKEISTHAWSDESILTRPCHFIVLEKIL
eukprot:c289_g1_i1.p1 GENE.c289_g1_i1~~c289_g1_i1.p1  ORF type:complete len:217 (-),score=41.30 c289_g1_i1:168-746(-)